MFFAGSRYIFPIFLISLILVSGCSKKINPVQAVDKEKRANLIAVLPVINKTTEADAARILRERIVDELVDKGYKKISLKSVDEKLSKYYKSGAMIAPDAAGELLHVDAVLYCTLSEWKTAIFLAYGSVSVQATFELRLTKTGEVLWRETKRVGKRNLHPFREELKLLELIDYEDAIHDLVDEAMASIPKGPNFIALGPPKRSIFKEWF
jgi:hypothetical protein